MKLSSPVLGIAAVLAISTFAAHAQIVPITVTGFDTDAVFAGGADGVNGDVSGPGGGGYRYFTAQYASENPGFAGGLPTNGTVNSGITSAVFQFAPFTGNNLVSVTSSDVTLSLATPGTFSDVSFLVNNLNYAAPTTASFTLNFSSGPSVTLTTSQIVPYWAGGVPASTAAGEVAGVAATYSVLYIGGNEDGTPINFDEYDFTLSPADAARTLESVTIDGSTGNRLDVYAVSGVASPEPSTWAMLLGGAGVLLFAGRLRRVLSL